MPVTRTDTYENYVEMLDMLEETTTTIRAFAELLERALREPDSMKDHSYGIWRILTQQCEDLRFLRTALCTEIGDIKASKLAVKNSAQIAERAGTSQYVVNRVISLALGVDLGPPTEHHTGQPPYCIREPRGTAHV